MNITYKKLDIKHIDQLLELFVKLKNEDAEVTFAETVEKKQIEYWLRQPNYYLYGALIDENVVGLFRGIRGLKNEDHCVLITIAIDSNYRRKHIAQNLIQFSLDDIKKREKAIILARAYVFSDNKASINTMLCCGFTISGSVYQHHFNELSKSYIDDIIFHKIL